MHPDAEALTELGYLVLEVSPHVWLVEGFGIRSQFATGDLAALLGVAHVERAFQINRPEAADVRRRLILTGHTVTRPDPLVDVFDVAGPLMNETGIGHVALANRASVLDAHDATVAGNERTIDQRLEQQLPVLRDAIAAITASPPTLFAGLNNQERVFLRRMARNQADLIRLVLRLLEATD